TLVVSTLFGHGNLHDLARTPRFHKFALSGIITQLGPTRLNVHSGSTLAVYFYRDAQVRGWIGALSVDADFRELRFLEREHHRMHERNVTARSQHVNGALIALFVKPGLESLRLWNDGNT